MKFLNLLFVAAFLLGIDTLSAQSTSQRAQQESVQRLEKVMVLSKNLDEGRKLLAANDLEKS